MSSEASQGFTSKLYVQTGSGQQLYQTASSGEVYEFLTEDLGATRQVLDTGGIRGTRSMPKERTREGVRAVQGTIVMHPSPADLDKWLPRILGTAAAGTTFALGDTFDEFSVLITRDQSNFEYTHCKVTRAEFRSQPNGFVEMSLTIIGGDEFEGVSAPTDATLALSTADNAYPYVFHDSCGNVQIPSGTARELFDIAIAIDNVMDARFVNCPTVTSITPQDRIVSLSCTTPYDASNATLFRQTTDNGPAFVKFENGNMSLRFDFASLKGPDQSPVVTGKNEIVLRHDFMARSSASTLELEVTNDSTA
jgi:hypothetical protein